MSGSHPPENLQPGGSNPGDPTRGADQPPSSKHSGGLRQWGKATGKSVGPNWLCPSQ